MGGGFFVFGVFFGGQGISFGAGEFLGVGVFGGAGDFFGGMVAYPIFFALIF